MGRWTIAFFIWLIAVIAMTEIALAQALDTWPVWSQAQPYVSKQVPPGAMIMRGRGTDAYYVLEVDPTTGEIPVSAEVEVTIEYSGPTGDPVPSQAAYVGGIDGNGDLQGISVDTAGQLQIDVVSSALPSGAATLAEQQAQTAILTTIDGDTGSINTKTPALGQAAMAASSPVVIASDQSAVPVSGSVTVSGTVAATQSGAWNVGVTSSVLPTGAATETTLANVETSTAAASGSLANIESIDFALEATQQQVVTLLTSLEAAASSKVYADSVRHSYSSGNVTTGAWTQLIASTADEIDGITLFDSSGQTLELGIGAAASETRLLLVPPGGISGFIPIFINSGTRLSVRAVSATADSGELVLTGYSNP